MAAICPKKADLPANTIMPNAPQSRRSRSCSRRVDPVGQPIISGLPRRAALGQGRNPVRRAALLRSFAFRNRSLPATPPATGIFSPAPDLGEGPGKRCSSRIITRTGPSADCVLA